MSTPKNGIHSSNTVLPFAIALAFIAPLSVDAVLPGFEAIRAEFQASPGDVATLLSFYMACYAFMSLWHGALSDQIGRRKATYFVTLVYIAGSALCMFSTSLLALQIGRIVQGLVTGAGLVIARAMVRDVFEGVLLQKNLSLLTTVLSIPPVVGPIAGGWIVMHSGWRAIFLGLSASALLLLLACVVSMPETLPKERRTLFSPGILVDRYRRTFFDRTFQIKIGSTALLLAGQFVYIGASPFIISNHYKMDAGGFAHLFTAITIGVFLGGVTGSYCAGKLPPSLQARIGLTLALLAAGSDLAIATSKWEAPPFTFWPSLVYAFGMILVIPIAVAATLEHAKENAGVVSSCQVFFQAIGLTITAWFVVPAVESSMAYISGSKLIFCVAGALLWTIGPKLFDCQPPANATDRTHR